MKKQLIETSRISILCEKQLTIVKRRCHFVINKSLQLSFLKSQRRNGQCLFKGCVPALRPYERLPSIVSDPDCNQSYCK